ncbi:MAG TPA: hypothetical protein EYQ27_09480, partial [Gemmatimonadetes bacterium]|nr:hypothetical protein [Gemmatimonadota bacterium]
MLTRGFRPVQDGALGAVEAGEVTAAREGGPDDAVPRHVDSPRRKAPLVFRHGRVLEGRLVHFGYAALGWVVPDLQAKDPARHSSGPRNPDGVVHRIDDDSVCEARELSVEVGIHRSAPRVPGLCDASVAVGIDDRGAPALSSLGTVRETRRRHPLADGGEVLRGIEKERQLLADVRARADVVIDTSDMNTWQLREAVAQVMKPGDRPRMRVTFSSFGFKHGVPREADLMFDVRFLRNPHYVPELTALTG